LFENFEKFNKSEVLHFRKLEQQKKSLLKREKLLGPSNTAEAGQAKTIGIAH
jgi:hypothetical protein